MSLFKRGKWYWMDVVVNSARYRLPLKTKNWQEAKSLEKDKIAEIKEGKLGSQGKVARQTFDVAADAYLQERELFKAKKTYTTECERSRPLRKFFGDTALRRITADMIFSYQKERKEAGLANKTVNLEVALLRQILKRHKQWNRLADGVTMLPKSTKPARILTAEEKQTLLATSKQEPAWLVARCAAIIALNTTMRGCELKGLRRKNVDLFEQVIKIERDNTKEMLAHYSHMRLKAKRAALKMLETRLPETSPVSPSMPSQSVN